MKRLLKRISLQIDYLLGKKIRPYTCKYCGTVKNVSKKYGPSWFTPPGAIPCDFCVKYVSRIKPNDLLG